MRLPNLAETLPCHSAWSASGGIPNPKFPSPIPEAEIRNPKSEVPNPNAMPKIGIASIDITPRFPVWMCGYGSRDHKSEGVYLKLKTSAISLTGTEDEAIIVTADLIGYGIEYAARAKMVIAEATGLVPRQIVLTATHTHGGPLFYPMTMPGETESEYGDWLLERLVTAAARARKKRINGFISFSRGRSRFGVCRRLPDGEGGVRFAPNPNGPIDRDLDTFWFCSSRGRLIGSLTVYGCHPTSLGHYEIGGDYPGFVCSGLSAQTGAPALWATGCAGNVRPWFKSKEPGFARPSMTQVETAAAGIVKELVRSRKRIVYVPAERLTVSGKFHPLPYRRLPGKTALTRRIKTEPDPLKRRWAETALAQLKTNGALPQSCPQEIQILALNENFRTVFLAGELLAEIGLRIKDTLKPATTVMVAYANGLIGYVPGKETYSLGGYEVDRSHHIFGRPAPFVRSVEDRIVAKVRSMIEDNA